MSAAGWSVRGPKTKRAVWNGGTIAGSDDTQVVEGTAAAPADPPSRRQLDAVERSYMVPMPSVELSKKRLAALLREAAEAHHVYEEEELGHPDDAWAEWYAGYILDELGVDEEEPVDSVEDDLDVVGG